MDRWHGGRQSQWSFSMRAFVNPRPLPFVIRLRLGPLSFNGERKWGKKAAPQTPAGLFSSRERPLGLRTRVYPPTEVGDWTRTTVLVPDAGGRPISCLAARCPLPLSSATALPRKTVRRTHCGSMPCGCRWRSRTTLLVPDAGAGGFILTSAFEILHFAFPRLFPVPSTSPSHTAILTLTL